MKVVQIAPYYPPHVGGVEFHVKGLCDGLINRGYEVEVISSCGESALKFTRVPCINFTYFPVPLRVPQADADIFHSHVPSPTFAFFLKDAEPHIVTYHNDVIVPPRINGVGLPWPFRCSLEWFNKKLVEPVLEEAQVIVATTRSYAETSEVLKDHLHKIEIVPNAIDPSLYYPGERRGEYIIYVGRVVDYKGLSTLLDAMREVQKKERLKLVVVGDGSDRQHLQERASRMGLDAEFTGRIERRKLIDLISRAEMLVLPSASRLEAFGIVLLEAMACETPVLAYDTPGVGEVAREGGLVFSAPSEMADLILELHSDEPLRIALGKRGRRAVEERYSWTRVLDEIESIYREIS
jgi:glycosyltransferase involved in cell wall biosynthesis